MTEAAIQHDLLDRVRARLRTRLGIHEVEQHYGTVFTHRGNVICGVLANDLMIRVAPEVYEELLTQPHIRPMDIDSVQQEDMVIIEADRLQTDVELRNWLDSIYAPELKQAKWPERPWLDVMLRPRSTIRAIVDTAPMHGVVALWLINSVLAGVASIPSSILEIDALNFRGATTGIGESIITGAASILGILVCALPIGLALGYLIFYLYTGLQTFVGNKLGGGASGEEVRTAFGWSFVPSIISSAIAIVIMFPIAVVSLLAPGAAGSFAFNGIVLLFGFLNGLIAIISYIWLCVILIIGYSEVNEFGILRSIGSLLLIPVAFIVLFSCVPVFIFMALDQI